MKKSGENIHKLPEQQTAKCYGRLWRGHLGRPREDKYHFQAMQEVFPEKIVRGKVGLEVGCGSGWDAFTMATDNPGTSVISLDISDGVYTAQEVNKGLRKWPAFLNATSFR